MKSMSMLMRLMFSASVLSLFFALHKNNPQLFRLIGGNIRDARTALDAAYAMMRLTGHYRRDCARTRAQANLGTNSFNRRDCAYVTSEFGSRLPPLTLLRSSLTQFLFPPFYSCDRKGCAA